MYVKNRMTKNPITISPDSTISEVLDLMAQKNVHRLPVVEGDTLIGLLTEGVIQENSPSHASSLSIHEINYLLSKTMVKDIMIRKVITIGPDALLEEAALLMKKNEIGGLPVVVGNKLVGIITVNDILGAFVDLLGYYQPGSRVVIEVSNDRQRNHGRSGLDLRGSEDQYFASCDLSSRRCHRCGRALQFDRQVRSARDP